jgi:hypothetical protein
MHDIGLTHDGGHWGPGPGDFELPDASLAGPPNNGFGAGHPEASHPGSGSGLPMSEAHEVELASQALSLSSDHELEAFLGDVFRAVGTATGRFARPPVGRELVGMLRGAVGNALPGPGSSPGLDLPSLAQQAASLLGLELEGLSPQDQEFEAGRGLVRFLGGAYHHALGSPRHIPARTVARRAVIGSARRFAPGLLRGVGGAGQPGSHWDQVRDHRGGRPGYGGYRGYGWPQAGGWDRSRGGSLADGYGYGDSSEPSGWVGGDDAYDAGVPFVHRRHHRHHWYSAYPDPGWGYPPAGAPAPPGFGFDSGGEGPPPGAPGDMPGIHNGMPLDPSSGAPGPSTLGGLADPGGANGVAPTPGQPATQGQPGSAPTDPLTSTPPGAGTTPPPGTQTPQSGQSGELEGWGWNGSGSASSTAWGTAPSWGPEGPDAAPAHPPGSSRRGRWERHGGVLVVHGL